MKKKYLTKNCYLFIGQEGTETKKRVKIKVKSEEKSDTFS